MGERVGTNFVLFVLIVKSCLTLEILLNTMEKCSALRVIANFLVPRVMDSVEELEPYPWMTETDIRLVPESNGNAPAKPVSNFKPKWGGAEICPRCGKSVFIAELMRGAGKAWHKGCFTCNLCHK